MFFLKTHGRHTVWSGWTLNLLWLNPSDYSLWVTNCYRCLKLVWKADIYCWQVLLSDCMPCVIKQFFHTHFSNMSVVKCFLFEHVDIYTYTWAHTSQIKRLDGNGLFFHFFWTYCMFLGSLWCCPDDEAFVKTLQIFEQLDFKARANRCSCVFCREKCTWSCVWVKSSQTAESSAIN